MAIRWYIGWLTGGIQGSKKGRDHYCTYLADIFTRGMKRPLEALLMQPQEYAAWKTEFENQMEEYDPVLAY